MPAPLLFAALAAFPVPLLEAAARPVEMVIRLSVQPMPAPQPALRYLLLPELKEMSPGNPIPNYLKALLDQDFTSDQEVFGPAALRQVDRAARMEKPDWSVLLRLRTDGVGLLLPDVQKLRALAAGLQGRFREELTQRRFDDAIGTAKTMFAMARHMGEHPTLIGQLVGIAIATIAIAPLEEMLEQPGCPNLYWALTNLPDPLVPLSRGLEGERIFIIAELRGLDDRAPMTQAQIDKLAFYIDRLRELSPAEKEKTTRAWLDARVKDEAKVRAARARLVDYGIPEERVATFPPDQVFLLDAKRDYEVLRDEQMKLMSLHTWEVEALADQLKPVKDQTLLDIFVPALHKIRRAQGRLEQRIALLRHVEALRLYAAEHDGTLPATLAEVGVPLPLDPFTGKAFRYALEGGTAHLRGSPPKGEHQNPPYNLHYEITIRK